MIISIQQEFLNDFQPIINAKKQIPVSVFTKNYRTSMGEMKNFEKNFSADHLFVIFRKSWHFHCNLLNMRWLI